MTIAVLHGRTDLLSHFALSRCPSVWPYIIPGRNQSTNVRAAVPVSRSCSGGCGWSVFSTDAALQHGINYTVFEARSERAS